MVFRMGRRNSWGEYSRKNHERSEKKFKGSAFINIETNKIINKKEFSQGKIIREPLSISAK